MTDLILSLFRSMHECIKKLLANLDTPEEEDIESLCRLLLTVGYQIENTSKDGHGYMDIYFVRLKAIVDNNTVSSRLVFMIQVSRLPSECALAQCLPLCYRISWIRERTDGNRSLFLQDLSL